MLFYLKYCLVIKCVFLCSHRVFAGNINLLAPKPQTQHNEEKNILNGDVSKKLMVWKTGIIPYYIDDFSFDKVTRDKIRMYLSEVGSLTKLQFVELPRPPDDDKTRWVIFVNRQGLLGCDDYYATNFTKEGIQKIVVGYDCLESGDGLAAAVLALTGIPPEHNSPKRISSIKIKEENIIPDKLHLFKMIEEKDWPFVNLDYDFSSASHYDFYTYSINGHMTINPVVQPTQKMNEGLSSMDILKIKIVYEYSSKESQLSHQDCAKMFRLGSKSASKVKNHGNKKIIPKQSANTVSNTTSGNNTFKKIDVKEALYRKKRRSTDNPERINWKNMADYHSDD